MSNPFVTIYRCDVCHTASFATMAEALEHETKCALAANDGRGIASLQPQSQTPPPQTIYPPGDVSLLRVKYFKCSKCKVLFEDRSKARAHEATCTEPVWFSCGVCKIMRFANTNTLVEHERSCQGSIPLTKKDLPLAEEIFKDKICVQSDDSSVEIIEPTIKHNLLNKVPNKLLSSAPTFKSPEVKKETTAEKVNPPIRTNISLPSSAPPEMAGDGGKVRDTPTVNNKTTTKVEGKVSSSSNTSRPTQSNYSSYITCWTCDVCQVAHFKTFEEAEEHENQCKIEMENRKNETGNFNPPKLTNNGAESLIRSRPSSKDEVLFSPFVQGVSDSPDFDKLSNCHAAILQSVKLLHHPLNGSVALQCQYCNEGMSTTWTFKKMTEMLPVLMCNHILDCQNAPAEVVTSMKEQVRNILHKSSTIVGELSLENFLESYLANNGIVEGVVKSGTRLVVLPDEVFMKIPGCENSKRGRQPSPSTAFIGKKTKRRESSAQSFDSLPAAKHRNIQSRHEEIKIGDMDCHLHYEEGRSLYVGPLDGLPLLTSFLQEEAKSLQPSQKVLLAQLEIFQLSPKLTKEADSGSLGFRCQNCITEKNGCCFMKLTSINNLVRDLILFGKEHIVACVTKPKVTKQIQNALVGGSVSELSKYCNLIANLYGMEERTVDGKIQVVWGQSPTVPSGYSRPDDIDVRSILRASTSNLMNSNIEASSNAPQKSAASSQDVPSSTSGHNNGIITA